MAQTGQIILQGRSTQIGVVRNSDIALLELVQLWAQQGIALYSSQVCDTYVSGFEKTTHFAQYVNNSYGMKQSCR